MRTMRASAASLAISICLLALASSPARAIIDNSQHADGNAIDCVVTNHDSYAYDLISGNAGLIWPRGTAKTAVFAAGLWIGARMNSQTAPTVKVGEYSAQWGPGPIVADSSATVTQSSSGLTPRTWKPRSAGWSTRWRL